MAVDRDRYITLDPSTSPFLFLPPTTTMDPSSFSSSSRAPPFSLLEFGDLVSAALDSPDPLLSFNSPVLSLSRGSDKTPSEDDQSGSRMRQMLNKFKKRASALVKRPSTRPSPRLRASSPEYRIPELSLSASIHNVSCDNFVPYLPLVTQYERTSPYEHPFSTFSSTPSLPSQYSTRSLYTNSNSSYSSVVPSPSTSSCSSSSDSQYPITPLTTVSEEGYPARRWSASSTEPDGPSADPFAKPAVCVVPHTFSAPARPLRRRRARLPLAPAKPPPTTPIPPPPAKYTHPYARAPTPPSLLDAFPAPPAHTPTPPATPRRYRASSPFPFTPPRAAGADWLDLSSPPGSPGSLGSESGHSDVFHSACSAL
ncbi:hypothetical protein DFH07DRAFT_1067281 [Mycena maculata]|uniref:Uncharacterized protein n=1 Tax=Mycena maculata TaxID=230809 RepID=A0AAD7HL79_9AGAR|nr:hypothetical protein DFH07DRAFT_1067281 [Mycena maculata]